MSEEERKEEVKRDKGKGRKEDKHKVKIPKHFSKYFGIASFVLGLFSFMIMLFIWIIILIDMCEMMDGVSEFWENVSNVLEVIIFFSD